MFGALMAAASARIAETRQSIVRLVIGVAIAVAASIMLVSALLSALFMTVAFYWGPVAGHLTVAGVALLIAIIALIYAFARPRRQPAPLPAVNAASLGTAAVDAAAGVGAKAAGSAATQAFDAARSAGERIRSIGEALSADIAGERKQPVARKTIINAALTAVLVGLLIGRKL